MKGFRSAAQNFKVSGKDAHLFQGDCVEGRNEDTAFYVEASENFKTLVNEIFERFTAQAGQLTRRVDVNGSMAESVQGEIRFLSDSWEDPKLLRVQSRSQTVPGNHRCGVQKGSHTEQVPDSIASRNLMETEKLLKGILRLGKIIHP